jgi:hypothetical protein
VHSNKPVAFNETAWNMLWKLTASAFEIDMAGLISSADRVAIFSRTLLENRDNFYLAP